MIDLGLLYQFITNNILSLAVVIYKTAVDLELVYKFITNKVFLAILLLVVIYIGNKASAHKIGLYVTIKYFSMVMLVVVSGWYFVYTSIIINNPLDAKDNLQLVVVFFASLSIFLITLDFEYTKNFSDLKDILLDSKIYVPFSQKVGDSKFEFKKMVRSATTSIFIIGPNLAFLSKEGNQKDMKELLFEKFRANPKFEIRMLIMDPENENIQKINLGFTKHFWSELDDSVKVFKQWTEDAKAKDAKASDYKFNVRVTDVLTLSLLFRDKSTSEGCVLVTPIPNGSEGANRSCVLIKKKIYEMAFYEYYDAYNKIFDSEEHSKGIEDVWTHIGDSKFEFEKMVHAATTSIFIIGPNIAFLSKEENKKDMKELLFEKFRANPKFEIRMLIMDPENENIQKINLGFTKHFWSELDDSVKVFKQWAEDAKASDYKFNVRVTNVLNFSLIFRDESTPEGCVLVTPIPNGCEGANRSCFLVKKKIYEKAFCKHYDEYNKIFNSQEDSKDIEDVWAQMEDHEKLDINK